MNDNLNDLVNLGDEESEQIDEIGEFISENIESTRNEDKFTKSEFKHDELFEIGYLAIWSLSSWKLGNGIDKLRDDNDVTYWQSDGTLPHFVNIQFHKKVFVVQISISVDYKNDESYTPNRITIRAGTHFGDLQDLRTVELERPCDWIDIQISGDEILSKESHPVGANLFQIAIKSNHQNGKDTRIRQIKIFALKPDMIKQQFKLNTNYEDDSDEEIITFPATESFPVVR